MDIETRKLLTVAGRFQPKSSTMGGGGLVRVQATIPDETAKTLEDVRKMYPMRNYRRNVQGGRNQRTKRNRHRGASCLVRI